MHVEVSYIGPEVQRKHTVLCQFKLSPCWHAHLRFKVTFHWFSADALKMPIGNINAVFGQKVKPQVGEKQTEVINLPHRLNCCGAVDIRSLSDVHLSRRWRALVGLGHCSFYSCHTENKWEMITLGKIGLLLFFYILQWCSFFRLTLVQHKRQKLTGSGIHQFEIT